MSNNVTARTTTSAYFTYDHINKRIVGTDINFSKAGIDGSVQYKALMAAMAPLLCCSSRNGFFFSLLDSYAMASSGETSVA